MLTLLSGVAMAQNNVDYLAAKERIPTPRRILADDAIEEINRTLSALQKGQIVTVVYYGTYEQDYVQLTGPVTKVDSYWHSLQIGDTIIDFPEIDKLWLDALAT